jgi:hypothetical protein
MGPESEDAKSSAEEVVDERVRLHHDENVREALDGIMGAEEGEATSDSEVPASVTVVEETS